MEHIATTARTSAPTAGATPVPATSPVVARRPRIGDSRPAPVMPAGAQASSRPGRRTNKSNNRSTARKPAGARAARYSEPRRGRSEGPAGGTVFAKVLRPVCESRPSRPVVVLDGDVTLLAGSASSELRVGDRRLLVDAAASQLLASLDGDLRWSGATGALAQAVAVELGLGRWPTTAHRSFSPYGSLACDDISAQLSAEPARPLVWVASAARAADVGGHLESLAEASGTPLLVVPCQGAFGPTEAAQVAEFLATH